MLSENKVTIYAPIDVEETIPEYAREKASVLAFPDERQGDLQYIRSVMVSAGTNKNGAHFLPSEMMQAHNTIINKAIDLEHEETKVIGHIYDCAFVYKNGEVFDPGQVLAEYRQASRNVDEVDIDIVNAGVIHKLRFPEIAEEILHGAWKVSMECYFKDFDIKMGNTIITRQEAESLGYDPVQLVTGFVKVMAGKKELGIQALSRVLRGITFSGLGLVKNPANPDSIILETASLRERLGKENPIIDLERIDNLKGRSYTVKQEKGTSLPETPNVELPPQSFYVELDSETGGIKRILSTTQETAGLRYNGPGILGPGSVTSWPDDLCKSFKKRVTKFNALDQSEGVVLHEHWCALFEEPCPVIGASSKAPECLRNQRNAVTRNLDDTTITKSIREHLDNAPSNTFTTILQVDTAGADYVQDRRDQITRLRDEAESLRRSLRDYVAAEKKSLI